jgi:hypothetical protein
MAERKEPPGDSGQVQDPVESAQRDDLSQIADEREDSSAGEDAQVIAFRRDDDESATDSDAEDLVDLDEIDEPVDLAALQSDDALLDALGGTNPDIPSRADGEGPDLEALLVAWRRDVDAAPIGDLVDTDAAVAAIAEGRRPRRLRRRHLVPVATAAAVLMITFTGVGLAAKDALPGDMLWGVAQVLYTDHARVVEAATSARIELANANAAFLQGDRNAAEAALKRAQEQMQAVDAQHGLSQLQETRASLAAKFDEDQTSSNSTSFSSTRPMGTTSMTPSTSPNPQPPVFSTTSGTPSSTLQPTQPTTSPSSSSDSSERPSSTTSSSGNGLFGPHS